MTIGSNASSHISQQLPGFLEGGNFQVFLEAYYEWLELQRDSESKNVKQLFKNISGPAALISSANANRDIDSTLKAFVQYFYDQVIPVVIEGTHVDTRFAIKKVRDLYLAKGTPNSFKLFFRMLYAEEIDVFFPFDSVLRASFGKYLSFPQVRAVVVEGQDVLSFFNFQLSTLYNDSDGIDSGILVVDGFALSNIGGQTVINLTLNSGDIDLDFDRTFILQDSTNAANYISIKILVQLEDAIPVVTGAGFNIGDTVVVYDPALYPVGVANLRVSSIKSGPVTDIQIRDRGESYVVGDYIRFSANDRLNGQGGLATITSVDDNGRILSIDSTMARTGIVNTGYLTDDFVNANVPITEGGNYRTFPNTEVVRIDVADRYKPLGGLALNDAQVYAVSPEIAQINTLVPDDPGFFLPENTDKLVIRPPFNIVTGGNTDFDVGAVLEFQYFLADSEGFEPDSEVLDINITIKRRWTAADNLRVRVPESFDNDSDNSLFQWIPQTVALPIPPITATDSDVANMVAQVILPGYNHVQGNPPKVDDIRLYRLDGYHFNQLSQFFNYEDQFIKITYFREFQNPRIRSNLGPDPLDFKPGQFIPTGLGGRISRRNTEGTQYSLEPYPTLLGFPTDSDITYFDKIPFSIIRVVQVNPITGDQVNPNAFPFPVADYVSQWYGSANLDLKLSGPIYTARRFINEDGFLDSPSGSVLRDNYFYSEYSYVLQSTQSIAEWGAKVRQLLHPAGTVLLSELNVNTTVPAPVVQDVEFAIMSVDGTLQMDNTLDAYIADVVEYTNVTADTTVQATDPYLLYNRFNADGLYLTSDNFGKYQRRSEWSQRGNAFWDYEPVGLVNGRTTQFYNQADSDFSGNHYSASINVKVSSPYTDSEIDYYKAITDMLRDNGTGRNPEVAVQLFYGAAPVLVHDAYFDVETNSSVVEIFSAGSIPRFPIPFTTYDSDRVRGRIANSVGTQNIINNIQWFPPDTTRLWGTWAISMADSDTHNAYLNYHPADTVYHIVVTNAVEVKTDIIQPTYNIFDTDFLDVINDRYAVYDSDVPGLQIHPWTDSDTSYDYYFRTINYDLLTDSDFIDRGTKYRTVATGGANRNAEFRALLNADLQSAMRLDGTLRFVEGDKTYYDFAAFERKWNTINALRTINANGWEIPGHTSMEQNIAKGDTFSEANPSASEINYVFANQSMYATTKTPLTTDTFNWLSPTGAVSWVGYYYPINNSTATYVFGPFPRTTPEDAKAAALSVYANARTLQTERYDP